MPNPRRRPCRFLVLLFLVLGGGAYLLRVQPGEEQLAAAPPKSKSNSKSNSKPAPTPARTPYTVLGYNELGMHCMNQDFSEMCILPPFNTLRAQVIDRSGDDPRIVTSGVSVTFSIPGNTISSTKTNFWDYAPALFGHPLLKDVGLTGNLLSGPMLVTPNNDWSATGIPMTPLTDKFQFDPFQLSQIVVRDSRNGNTLASTQAVVPVSWEINCNLCHNTPGISVAADILQKHDKLHGTKLQNAKPVLCANCHADPA
jgi:hypothetical protein